MTAETAALNELHRLSSRLWQAPALQAGLEEMLDAMVGLLEADMGAIQLLDERRERLVVGAHVGFAPAFLTHITDLTATDDSPHGRLLRASGPTLVEDVDTAGLEAPLRQMARDGGYRAVLYAPLVGRSGRPLGMLSVHFRAPHVVDVKHLRVVELYVGQAADFVERLQTDAALRKSERLYRTLFDAIDEGFCIIEFLDGPHGPLSDYIHVEANRAYERHAGIANVVGQKVREMVPHEAEGWVELYRRVLLTGQPLRFVRELVATGRYLELYAFRVEPEARRQVAVLFQDVTDRKRAEVALQENEQRLRQMADTMAHMIWVTRPDGYHEWYNRRWYEFTGVPEGSTDGDAWNGLFHADDQARARARWQHSLDTGESYEIEYRLRHRSGEYRWVLGRAMPIRDERGEIERWFGTCTDIHAMRQLMDEREHLLQSEQVARIEIERASRMKDEFLATLSHEIRTPLNAILGWATILRSRRLGAEGAAQGLETIERSARLQAQMIDDLLDMSRIISGKLRLDVQRVDLADVLRAAAETVSPAAAAKDIRMQLVLDPQAGPVGGDPNRLQQVFWNLLSNAIKFTTKGGRVQVLLERIESHVEVSVNDTGEGIEPAFLPHVFDRFRQADATTTRRHGGLGLGLAIAKQVVELHGGTIGATSPGKGRGATFSVALPLSAVQPESEPPPERRHPATETLPVMSEIDVRLAGVRVLVVDDEPDARTLLRQLFEEHDAVVSTAASVAEAIAALQALRPDVLVSDIGMPDADGYTLIRRVRALPPEQGGRTPAIALTAYARAEDRVRAIAAGFQHHLSKPIEPAELLVIAASLTAGR
jgi:PAS domain S-box-containing protein